jgi:asparagine synthase (glutamine-hydrolysing)
MCGICGIVNFDPGWTVSRSALESMNREIIHRGPDDCGFHVSENVGLAMRRLSIIDVKTGHQPVTNEDGTVWLVYNGEIYNYRDLRGRLLERGHQFRTQSDTETIVHLYEEHGRECVEHLRGMFAFALWDNKRRRLLLARDRLGIKPLYYCRTQRQFLFASEIKSLFATLQIKPALNRRALPQYLAFGYVAGSETLFDGVHKLLPGHTLELDETGRASLACYWDLPLGGAEDGRSRHYYAQTYREQLEQCVSSHLMSEVPLGVFLSGGLDSSVVAALTTKLRGEPVKAFSVGYDEVAYSELPYARLVARHIGAEYHEVRVGWQDFFGTLPKLIWHEDEPLAWPSSVSLYFVAKLAREHVTVVLTGEGSDETLAGYARYATTLWNTRMQRYYRCLLPAALRHSLRRGIQSSSVFSADLRRKLRHSFVGRDATSWTSIYFDNFLCAFAEAEQMDLLAEELRPEPGLVYGDSMKFWERFRGDLLHRMLYTDTKTYLVELLMKQDQMSMAASVESRVPFLDHSLVEFAASIPTRHLVSGRAGKQVLKAAVPDLLPESILNRVKMGFPTPWESWLRRHFEVIENLILDRHSLARGWFRAESLRSLLAQHRRRRSDHADRIWRLLNLELWARVCLDGEGVGAESTRFVAGAVS